MLGSGHLGGRGRRIGKYVFLFENPATINRSEFMVIKKEQRNYAHNFF